MHWDIYSIFNAFQMIFDAISNFICYEGGLINEINDIQRSIEVTDEGLLCDLFWFNPSIEHIDCKDSDEGASYS